ncbi:hemerythrin domain-containing protein, partial [Micromonospora azadirachtae]
LHEQGSDEVVERVHRHVAEVGALIAALRAAATEEELIRLGNRLEIAEEAAPTRPHPDTPATPPWNRVVEPALGVVDKVRDAVSGRPTYLADLPDEPPG